MAYKLHTAPTEEPVTLTEAKAHLVVSTTTDDALINSLIVAARQKAEDYTARQFCTATWKLYLDEFANTVNIHKSPVSAVSEIVYKDTDGTEQTLDTTKYFLDSVSEPARLIPAYGETWPSIYAQINAICITFTSGYGAAATVPTAIKAAMLLIIGHLYENRGDEGHRTIPKSVYDLLDPYKITYF